MSADRARLFVALELPSEARRALVQWRTDTLAGAEGVRPVAAEDLHVTLCFLGSRARADLDAIAEACAVLAGRGTVDLSLGEAVALPRRRPRVLAVSLGDRDGALVAVHAAISGALAARGLYEPEERPFYGHVTVARAGRGARIPRAALVSSPPPGLRFTASHVVVYRSHLRRGGASYEALATVPLTMRSS